MIQTSRSEGEFLKRYRLSSYGTGSTQRCIRGDDGKGCFVRYGSEEEWSSVDCEEELVCIIDKWFPGSLAEMARDALNVLRKENVNILEIRD
jgi:hypothetical protein